MMYEDQSDVSRELLQESSYYISQEMTNFMDKRTMKWMLIPSPIPIICILLAYLYVIYIAGRRFMKNKQPYSLKVFMQCYNIFQIVVNFWLMSSMFAGGKPFSVVWRYCDSFDKLCGESTEQQLKLIWWALIVKIIDLIETVVFVLRKKYQQVSFLHVYHHVSTVLYVWIILRYFTHGHVMYILEINTTVHVIMYSYYFLSACGPKIQQRVAPFKRWITIIQMIQILSITLTGSQGIAVPNCDEKGKYLSIITFVNGIANLSLFWNFYDKSYKKSKVV